LEAQAHVSAHISQRAAIEVAAQGIATLRQMASQMTMPA